MARSCVGDRMNNIIGIALETSATDETVLVRMGADELDILLEEIEEAIKESEKFFGWMFIKPTVVQCGWKR